MIEKEMGYRGSKSDRKISVKEQRVDGRWYGFIRPYLRCTLMGFERNYQIKNQSKQINIIRSYTSIANHVHNLTKKLNPWFITGFSDAEGNFTIRIVKCNTVK